MPERFDLTYVGSDNQKHRPVIIHRAPFGSMERFTSILIEHFAGDFPLWLAPTQLSILPISDDQNEIAFALRDQLLDKGIRVHVDSRSEQIGGKIRDAETSKTPYMAVIGAREAENKTVAVRKHKKGNLGTFTIEDFVTKLYNQIQTKSLTDLLVSEPNN
jgi:threonyl-tRNA synthetase